MILRLQSALLAFAFFFSATLVCLPESQAAVSPGQEQQSFEDRDRANQTASQVEEEEAPASVEFAKDRGDYEEDERPAAGEDEEESAPSARKGLVLPIQGKISVRQLRELVEAVKGAEDDEEVGITIQIGINGAGAGKRSVSYASEQFDKPLPPAGYNPAEQKDLKAAEREAQAEKSVAPLREEVPFFVEKINVTGNTAVSAADIRAIVASYEGRELKLSDAKEAADKITQLYRTRGLVTCRAYIPPQNIETKVLEIKVFEGKLGKVKIRGNKFFKKAVIRRYTDHLKNGPLKFDDLKSALTKLNMHPDREVKAVIVPGQEVGTSDLLLDVKDQRPIHVGGEINNFGTELTGRERYNVNVRHTNLLGVDDIFASRVQFGEEVFGIGLQHVLPVGPYGTQAGWTFNYTDVNVGGDFSALDIAGEAYTGSVFFSHPLRDGDHIDITGTASAESKSIYNTVLGAPSSEDQLRMLHAGANLDIIDRYGRSFIVNDLTFGTPWLDASDKNDPTLSRRGAGASFFKYDASFNRIHPVYDQTYLYMKGSAQVTADKLVSAEQYDIGGAYSVRGYPQSDYLGDSGFGGSLELRIPWFFLPHETKVPHTNVALWDRIHFIGFVDGAYATLRSPTVGEDRSKNYAGAGGGLRIDLPNNFLARLEWAAPVGDDPTDGSNGQFYFTVSSDFV